MQVVAVSWSPHPPPPVAASTAKFTVLVWERIFTPPTRYGSPESSQSLEAKDGVDHVISPLPVTGSSVSHLRQLDHVT